MERPDFDSIKTYMVTYPATDKFPEKLKAAAKLWKIVRESDQEKVYTNKLLEKLSPDSDNDVVNSEVTEK